VREIFETNTFGVFSTCRAIIPQMRKQGQGVIINVTSSAGIAPMPLVAVYAASKCAVEGFTESLSHELDQFAIKARLVEPGYAPTTNLTANGGARMQGLIPADYGYFAQSYFDKMANYPTAYCTEAEVAEAVFAAATEPGSKIRYPAGPDTKLVADLRWTTSEDHYLEAMRKMFRPRVAS
jgi:NAD(P)-dependent dehydrogenase (short-subunit alcohol dehydrogenase family)